MLLPSAHTEASSLARLQVRKGDESLAGAETSQALQLNLTGKQVVRLSSGISRTIRVTTPGHEHKHLLLKPLEFCLSLGLTVAVIIE